VINRQRQRSIPPGLFPNRVFFFSLLPSRLVDLIPTASKLRLGRGTGESSRAPSSRRPRRLEIPYRVIREGPSRTSVTDTSQSVTRSCAIVQNQALTLTRSRAKRRRAGRSCRAPGPMPDPRRGAAFPRSALPSPQLTKNRGKIRKDLTVTHCRIESSGDGYECDTFCQSRPEGMTGEGRVNGEGGGAR
jgi:hypothetical protein